jgi:hypothetical protein
MTIDRYTRAILTVIAAALVYLCVLQTPWPGVSAQTALRPGESTGPAQVVVIGWTAPAIPVQVSGTVPVTGEVRVTGNVRTRPEDNTTSRVVLVGWEDRASSGRTGTYEMFNARGEKAVGLPVTTLPVR